MERLRVQGHWSDVFGPGGRAELERVLPSALPSVRWFADKAREVRTATVQEAVPFAHGTTLSYLTLIEVGFTDGDAKTYVLPWSFSPDRLPGSDQGRGPSLVVPVEIVDGPGQSSGFLYDALWDEGFVWALLDLIESSGRIAAHGGWIAGSRPDTVKGRAERVIGVASSGRRARCSVMTGEQSNSSVVVGEQCMLKLYRQLGEGINPELEIGRVLTNMRFPHSPALLGSMEYGRPDREPVTLAIVQRFVRNQGDAWWFSLGAAQDFFSRVAARGLSRCPAQVVGPSPLDWSDEDCPGLVRELIGPYLESAERLGARTAELHVALAQASANVNFAPEPATHEYWTMRYESQARLTERALELLRARTGLLPAAVREEAACVMNLKSVILAQFRDVMERDPAAWRIRCHGDYHLGQVLCADGDFIIIDFEGEPARSLAERRTKHPVMVDVAGLLRSLHYVPFACLDRMRTMPAALKSGPVEDSEAWAECWSSWASTRFLKAYVSGVARQDLWPADRDEAELLLVSHLLEKAVYELAYELNNRPDWIGIPLRGILKTLELTRR
ncbi:MAG TPA: putative maltokinase [Nitrospiraceae bacterium]|nr:putative maltokinase [Nitrospiraceae bacterium]